MAYGKFAQEYRRHAVESATPLQLIVMLYDGALKFMEAGKHAMQHRDLERQNDQLQRAQKIIFELMSCLDMERGGEVAQNLLGLYTFSINELVRSNVEDDIEGINHAIDVFSGLRDAWSELERRERPAVGNAA